MLVDQISSIIRCYSPSSGKTDLSLCQRHIFIYNLHVMQTSMEVGTLVKPKTVFQSFPSSSSITCKPWGMKLLFSENCVILASDVLSQYMCVIDDNILLHKPKCVLQLQHSAENGHLNHCARDLESWLRHCFCMYGLQSANDVNKDWKLKARTNNLQTVIYKCIWQIILD